MKVTLEVYQKIHQYKELGLSKKKTAEKMKISRCAVTRWWDSTEDNALGFFEKRWLYTQLYEPCKSCKQVDKA